MFAQLNKPWAMPKMTGDNKILTSIFTFSVLGLKQEEELRNERKEFPPCNVEYKTDPERTRFWCTTVSAFWLVFELNHWNVRFSIPGALSATGPVIQFSSSTKTKRHSRAYASRRRTSIYLNLGRTRIVTTWRDPVLSKVTSRPAETSKAVHH